MATLGSPDPNLADILSVLGSKTTSLTLRIETYAKFTRHFKDNEVSLFGLDVARNVSEVCSIVCRDILSSTSDVAQGALQVLGVCLHDTEIVSSLSPAETDKVTTSLCQCVLTTEDKTTCTRALWCLGKQNLPDQIIDKQSERLLNAVEYANEKWGGQSITVEHECVNTIARMTEQIPKQMCSTSARWGKLLLLLVAHNAIRVRERVLRVIESSLSLLLSQQKELTASVLPVYKTKICAELKAFLANANEQYVLKSWSLLVQIFGEEMHHGSFINHMLPIVELGFKSSLPEIKSLSYNAWQQLIDNFATNPHILADPKRMKLIMQVFRMNNTRVESVAMVKLKVWWHFIWLLGNKVSANFDLVAAPILTFCVGGAKVQPNTGGSTTPRVLANGASPVTPRLNLTSQQSKWPVFPALQVRGCEILAHFLGSLPSDVPIKEYEFHLDHLRHDVVTGPQFFMKQASLFITSSIELFTSLGKDVPEGLVFHIWYSIVAHLKNAIESPSKFDIRDTLTTLLSKFQVLVLSRVLPSHIVLKMFQAVCCLPKKVLCSTAYSIGSGEISDTPALFLTELLLTPTLLQANTGIESYHELFSTIVGNDLGTTGTLGFLQSVLQLLARNTEFVENPETLWRFWSAVINRLLEHITKTSEVNQGDSLEHNFDCCIQSLIFPVKHRLPSSVPQPTVKTLLKTWTELYKTVNRLAAMVTNAEANIVCEEVCRKVLDVDATVDKLDAASVEFNASICSVVASSLDFSALGGLSTFGIAASPSKWTKKRRQHLENIHSLVQLLHQTQASALKLAAESEHTPKKAGNPTLQGMFNSLVDVFSTMFTHVTSSNVISNMIGHLAQPIGELYQEASKKSSAKIFNNAFQQKLEKLWLDIVTSLQSRYTAVFDSEFLRKVSPLLEGTFLHSRRQIKNQTRALWNSTFSKATNLTYPETLKPVLCKVKEKSTIQLPGWVAMTTTVIEETPISQMSQSQAPEPRIPGMPSPHKIHGSILHQAVSPVPKKSPGKSLALSPNLGSAKKKNLSFAGVDSKDFVVIKPMPKKPRVLTDHQKEVLKAKTMLPAMYNTLEISQDVSMITSQFNTDTQHEVSNMSTPTPTTQPFSLFGSMLPAKAPPTTEQCKTDITVVPSPEDSTTSKKKVAPKKKRSPKPVKEADDDSSTMSTRRRSVRFKDQEKSEIQKPTAVVDSIDAVKDIADSVVVIDDSERIDISDFEMVEEEGETRKADKGAAKGETNVEIVKEVISQTLDSITEIVSPNQSTQKSDSEKSETPKSSSGSADNVTVVNQAASSESSKDSTFMSIPSNVLGVIGYTPVSSSKSSESKSPGKLSQESESSEPLFSWSQKLSELSQSPRNRSPLKKFSQEIQKSPRQRSASPMKSPRRNRKRLTNENEEEQGNLDKWIIRSPAKALSNTKTDAIYVNSDAEIFSTTLVEDTMSPTKFNKIGKDKDIESKLHSIMETPPKNILENSLNIYSNNSNRKLFQSSGSDVVPVVEDSNIVPASPNSKSFGEKSGTPVLKLARLTDSEIRRYSPLKENTLDHTPDKTDATENEVVVKFSLGDESNSIANDETSHEHDDFSVFKPLDSEDDPVNTDFFSKSLTDTEKAMLKLSEDEKSAESVLDKIDMSADSETPMDVNTSPSLFSQDSAFAKSPNKSTVSQVYDPCFNNTFKSSNETKKPVNSETDSQESEKEAVTNESGGTFDILMKNTLVSDSTPQRGRKRKQIHPKKKSPEDFKSEKKKKKTSAEKMEPETIGSAKKSSNRIRGKKTRVSQEKEKNVHESTVEKESNDVSETSQEIMKKKKQKTKKENKTDKDKNKITSIGMDSHCDNVSSTDDENQKAGQMKNEVIGKIGRKEMVKGTVNKGECNEVEISNNDAVIVKEIHDKTLVVKGNSKKAIPEKVHTELTKIKEKSGDLEISEHVSMDSDSDTMKQSQEQSEKDKADLESEIVISGQKTPESRNSLEQPERKSTTKRKKAVAQKRVQKRERDIVINDSDSNLDNDDEPLITLVKKHSAENLEKKMIEQSKAEKNDKVIVERSDSGTDLKSSLTIVNSADEAEKNNKASRNEAKSKGWSKTATKNKEKSVDGEDASKNDNDMSMDVNKSADLSFYSDDDIPLIDIKILANKKHGVNAEAKKEDLPEMGKPESGIRKSSKGVKATKASPVAAKLRSSKITKVNLRSGEKKVKGKTSPQAKKSVNLALKRTRKQEARKKLDIVEDGIATIDDPDGDFIDGDSEIMNIDDVEFMNSIEAEKINIDEIERDAESDGLNEDNISKVVVDTETLDNNKSDKDILDSITDNDKDENALPPESTMERLNKLMSVEKEMDETPRKPKDLSKPVGLPFSCIHSDSKLILGSRKFEKRLGFARRSILKPSTMSAAGDVASPKREFHPIIVGEIYSPTASPSASILKKRRLSVDPEVDTSSPPNKQRRVSFAEPIIEGETTQVESVRPASPLVTRLETKMSAAEKVSTLTTTQESSCHGQPAKPSCDTQSSLCTPTPSQPGTPTQNTYQSTQEMQLNTVDPIFPDLLHCKTSVEKVLPQLTSSVWSRGLGQLVRARNIHTIGDLCALTETDIHSLPIKSPKVVTVRKALGRFGDDRQIKRSKLWGAPKVAMDSGTNGDSAKEIITAKADLATESKEENKVLDENTSGDKQEVIPADIDAILASSGDLLDEVNKLTQTVSQSGDQDRSHDAVKSQSESMDLNSDSTEEVGIPAVKKSTNSFLDSLAELASNCESSEIQGLRTDQLFQAHQYITDLQNKVVRSLRERCHSPTS